MCGSERLIAAFLLLMAGSSRAGQSPPPPASPLSPRLAAAPATTDPAPAAMVVPAGLARRAPTVEPSGVVWSQALDRYLIVSDDTGPETDHHEPWILAMNREGVLDEAVVPILGIDAINDAEAICAGPGGTFFIATSHSPNRKGRTPRSRRLLLLTKPEGRALRVVGRLDLTTARTAAGGGVLDIAGLPADGRLDIEAVAFRDGGLLIGLKSPLSVRDTAVILRLEAPDQAARAGVIPVGALTRLWELSLAGGGPGKAPRGVADLSPLGDGSLIIVANAPKGRATDQGGAVFWLRPGGSPQLLRWFENLRPEGATLAADGRSLIVVFDNHERPPSWTRLAVPSQGGAR